MTTSHPAASASPTGPFTVAVRGVHVSRADRPVLASVDLTFSERSRAAIVGPNGIGKSTLLRVIAGRLTPDSGAVEYSPPGVTVGLLDQELSASVPGIETVRALVADRLGVRAAEAELDAASRALAEPSGGADGRPAGDAADRYQLALDRYLALGAADLDARLGGVAAELGLADRVLDANPRTLSGGEAERVGLAMVMLSRFDLTLLDEPTNNLDLDGLDRLERWVAEHAGGLILVSHDRTFLERVVSTVVEIDHHHHTVSEFNGGWQAYLDERAAAAAAAASRYEDYVAERTRLGQRAQQQREWASKGVSRVKKHPADGDKHRRNFQLNQTEKLVAKAKATKQQLERLEEVEKPWQAWDLRFTIDRAPRSASVVAAFDGAVVSRGRFLLGPVDLEVRWTDRLAVVGRNGSGKSTLLDAMLGRLEPSDGRILLGSGVVVGELDQGRGVLAGPDTEDGHGFDDDRGRSLVRTFQDTTGLVVDEARSVLAKFGLDSEAVSRPARSLSPGERTRANLALFQARGVNLLVLDEPTNHLDMEAIEQLESALDSFDGTLVLVTHDRRLLTNVSLTRTVEVERDGDRAVVVER